MAPRWAAAVAALAVIGFSGACGDDGSTAADDSAASSSADKAQAAATCATIRTDLDRLTEAIGVPGSLDEAKRMISDGTAQIRRTLRDVKDAVGDDGGDLAPVRESLDQAVQDAEAALRAAGKGDFGAAKDKLGAAGDGVGQAKDRLQQACSSSA